MLVADILHSCADVGVAEAAVASIGGDFAESLRAEASHIGVSVGALTVALVSSFTIDATERDWRQLMAALAGEDHPVLSGLRTIPERMLVRPASVPRGPPRRRDQLVPALTSAAPASLSAPG